MKELINKLIISLINVCVKINNLSFKISYNIYWSNNLIRATAFLPSVAELMLLHEFTNT